MEARARLAPSFWFPDFAPDEDELPPGLSLVIGIWEFSSFFSVSVSFSESNQVYSIFVPETSPPIPAI